MISIPDAVPVPLHADSHGKIRVGETRVLLELVIHAYLQGETAESIVDSYPTLKLADVYAVLSYYLDHHAEVDEYVRKSEAEADEIQRQVEANYTPETRAFRARLHNLAQTRKSTG